MPSSDLGFSAFPVYGTQLPPYWPTWEWAELLLVYKVSLCKSGTGNTLWLMQPSTLEHGEWAGTGLQPPPATLEGTLG